MHKAGPVPSGANTQLDSDQQKSVLQAAAFGSTDDVHSSLIGHLAQELTCRLNVAAVPAGEKYTSGFMTAASRTDVAWIVVDAREGITTETRRHSYLISLLGIKVAALVIDKMDLVAFSQQAFIEIENIFRESAASTGFSRWQAIPLCALQGENVVIRSPNMEWYDGPTLLEFLETADIKNDARQRPFRLPIEAVEAIENGFRRFTGTIASGVVRRGDPILVVPSGQMCHIDRIVTSKGDQESAVAGQSIAVTLKENIIDIGCGDVVAAATAPPSVANQFETTLIWMHEEPMLQGRTYFIKIAARTASATVTPLKYRININSLEHTAAETLGMNDIGVAEIELDQRIPFEPFSENRALGGFTLIDKVSKEAVGAGVLHFALRRAENIHWQNLDVSKEMRARKKNQQPCVVWFTGLSGAGKSTIANLLEKRLTSMNCHTYLLDGDNVRHGLNKDLGFTAQDRVENIRRVAEVAKLMVDAGLIVLASFISPFRAERRMVRDLFQPPEFLEVFIDTPLSVAEERDPKGLYKKARRGELKNFTGIDSPYETPEHAEMRVDTTVVSAEEAASQLIHLMTLHGILNS